jgi:hypothetical protein
MLKHINPLLSVTGRCLAINSAVLKASEPKIVIEDIHKSRHLAKY